MQEHNYDTINEVFDSETIYPVTNLTPKAKVPQIIHIQAPGTNDIVVRLTSSDTIGTRVKAVKPGDKAVQVFLTSFSEKGNITDFKGGLGSDPVGALNTIFDTVIDICKQYKIEAILFRFPRSRMKGKDAVAQRVIKQLTKTRTAGRYTTLDDIQGLSKKFAFSFLYKKGRVLSEIPGIPDIDPDKFEKIETNAGDVYIDLKSGDKVTKDEVIAQSIVDASEKISQQQIVSTTKVSRRLVLNALYSLDPEVDEIGATRRDSYLENSKIALTDTNTVVSNPQLKFARTKFVPDLEASIDKFKSAQIYDTLCYVLKSKANMNLTNEMAYSLVDAAITDILTMLSKSSPLKLYSFYTNLIKYFNTGVYRKLQPGIKKDLITLMLSYLQSKDLGDMTFNYALAAPTGDFTDEERSAIKQYTTNDYTMINDFLRGLKLSKSKQNESAEVIKNLDTAFDKGTKLMPGTVLYRGMSLTTDQYDRVVKEGYILFPNYLSTSLYANIFTQYADSISAMAPNALEQPIEADTIHIKGQSQNVSVGMVLKNCEKVKNILPGASSNYAMECEVILPRGLLFKINKITLGSKNFINERSSALMELSLVPPEQLDENSIVYDGDALLEGKVEEIKPRFNFSIKSISLKESTFPDDQEDQELLASLINLDNVPDKFKS